MPQTTRVVGGGQVGPTVAGGFFIDVPVGATSAIIGPNQTYLPIETHRSGADAALGLPELGVYGTAADIALLQGFLRNEVASTPGLGWGNTRDALAYAASRGLRVAVVFHYDQGENSAYDGSLDGDDLAWIRRADGGVVPVPGSGAGWATWFDTTGVNSGTAARTSGGDYDAVIVIDMVDAMTSYDNASALVRTDMIRALIGHELGHLQYGAHNQNYMASAIELARDTVTKNTAIDAYFRGVRITEHLSAGGAKSWDPQAQPGSPGYLTLQDYILKWAQYVLQTADPVSGSYFQPNWNSPPPPGLPFPFTVTPERLDEIADFGSMPGAASGGITYADIGNGFPLNERVRLPSGAEVIVTLNLNGSISQQYFNTNGTVSHVNIDGHIVARSDYLVRSDAGSEDALEKISDNVFYRGVSVGDVGSTIGSVLGRQLGDGALADLLASAFLGALLNNTAESVVAMNASSAGLAEGFAEYFEDFGSDFSGLAVSGISSLLIAELMDELGLEGTLAGIGQAAGTAALAQVIQNLPEFLETGQGLFDGVTGINYGNIVGGYLGSQLADEISDFDSVYGQVGASLGSGLGSLIAGRAIGSALNLGAFGWAAGPLGFAIASFVGYLAGGLLGSMFGASKSYAEVHFDPRSGEFRVGSASAKRGGSTEAARALATGVADMLGGILAGTGATLIGGAPTAQFGMRNGEYVYWDASVGGSYTADNASAIISAGVFDLLSPIVSKLAGGDIYAKRALAGTLAQSAFSDFDAQALLGDLSVAADYAAYQSGPEAINAMIAADPGGIFAAGWAITMARAHELGLDRRGRTDWIGGWSLFLDEVLDGRIDGATFTAGNLVLQLASGERKFSFVTATGALIGSVGDTVGPKQSITGSAGNDMMTVNGATTGNLAGWTLDGNAASGQHLIPIAAVIDGGAGNDTIRGGDLGNDLLGGDGNDKVVGGKLDDWIFGGAGADVLFAGNVANISFTASDFAAERLAIAVDGGNGDYLDGGAGDDRLYGGIGSDWLSGGGGVDRLVGGAGGDVLDGGAGDDRGPAGAAGLLGGAGSDQYIFGFGYGQDMIFDESDPASAMGSTGDSVAARLAAISAGTLARSWQGGAFEVDGSIKGGEDTISFAPGVSMANVILQRSGTTAAPGQDLIITLVALDAAGIATPTGDALIIKDWFEGTRRVEWLRFADGESLRIGDIASFIVGTDAGDVILGSYGADFLYGGAGDDEIRGLSGDDFGSGGAGNDFVAGDGDEDWVVGGSGDDIVLGGGGHDTVFGDDGRDTLYGGDGHDLLAGGRGDDEIIGGAGDDIIKYSRGDGSDVVMDDLVNNWDLVYANGVYVNGYVLQANGTVTKNGVVWFDGSEWVGGRFDWNDETGTLRRHAGAVNGKISDDNGTDALEFGVGIDLQDLMFERSGNDLVIAVSDENATSAFAAISDKLRIKDWYTADAPIERMAFAATGLHDLVSTRLMAGTDNNDTLVGHSGQDWITGNAGDDVIDTGEGIDILVGGAGDDHLKAGARTDILYGGAGDDILDGGADADIMFGGAGMDTASYASDTATSGVGVSAYLNASLARFNTGAARGDSLSDIEGLQGTARNDRLGGGLGADFLTGARGDDRLTGGLGDDTYVFERGDGNDWIRDGAYSVEEVVNAAGQLDTAHFTATWTSLGFGPAGSGSWHRYRLVIRRNSDDAVVYQSRDNVDFLYASAQSAMPATGAWPFASGQWLGELARTGNDYQVAGEVYSSQDGGDDAIRFGAGISLSHLGFAMTGVDLQVSLDTGGGLTIENQGTAASRVESLEFDDGLTVDLQTLRLNGAGTTGADFLVGQGANEVLSGQAGNDVISGGGGDDTLNGGNGDDTLEGGAGADRLDGGADSGSSGNGPTGAGTFGDTIRYVGSTAAVTVDLALATASGGDAQGDVIVTTGGVSTIENVTGSRSFGDTLTGDSGRNRLAGLGGDDHLDGAAGDDILDGGDGADVLLGGLGDDGLTAGAGNDQAWGGDGRDILTGGDGNDSLYGDAGDDVLSGDAGQDSLTGGLGDDRISGGDGNDNIYGNDDDDTLSGGAGNDYISGGAGNDVITGDAGDDDLRGGSGNDQYVFGRNDGADRIVESSGINDLIFGEVAASNLWLTRIGDDLRIAVIGGSTVVSIDDFFVGVAKARTLQTSSGTLFLAAASPLIQAMTSASATTPGAMPPAVSALLATYWHAAGTVAPTVSNQTLTTLEDTPLSGQVNAVDQDASVLSYALQREPALGEVQLNTATGAWVYIPTANVNGPDFFIIKVTDTDGHTVSQRVNVAVTPVADAPRDIHALAPLVIDEMAANGANVGQMTYSDGDGPLDVGVFSLSNDAGGRFVISADGRVSVANGAALDHEAAANHEIVVRVTDSTGRWAEQTVTVTVGNVNEAPSRPVVTNQAITIVDENAAVANATIARVDATDPDGTDPTFVLTASAGSVFVVSGNEIRFKSTTNLNFEALRDAGYSLTDMDGDGLQEASLWVSVRSTDGIVQSGYQNVYVYVEDANEAPTAITVTGQVATIAERDRPISTAIRPAIVLGTLAATDPDSSTASDFATHVFSVTDTRFEIVNGNTLQLKANASLDYEEGTTVTVAVTVTDRGGSGLSFTRNLTFTVSNEDDYLYGTASANTLTGQANRDLIYGYGGNDAIDGGTGDDDLDGGDGNDILLGGLGVDRLIGGLGLDNLVGGDGNDTLTGGDGDDTLAGDSGDDRLEGEIGNDILMGGDGHDDLFGGDGADTLQGNVGNDELSGGEGDDLLTGGQGADVLNGGLGLDTATYQGATSGVNADLVNGGTLGDALGDTYSGIERLVGSEFADTLRGGSGHDLLEGGGGNDIIYGGAGNDELLGGAGNDILRAEGGGDRLDGGTGTDILIGGLGSDTYLIDANSGADEIQEFDPDGADVDVVGYNNISRDALWFSRSGDDLVVSVVGTTVQTTIKSWFADTTEANRQAYKIDFFLADQHVTKTINAEALVSLMAGYTKPATVAAYTTLHQNLAFQNAWLQLWDQNSAPELDCPATQTIAEDGTLTVQITVTDDITPVTGLTVTAVALNPLNHGVASTLVNTVTIGAPDALGRRTLTVTTIPNASGQVAIKIVATDPGGNPTEQILLLNIDPRADTPVITQAAATATTLDSGLLGLNIQAALVDQDGSETLSIRISNIPTGLSLNKGTNLGGGVWSLTPTQLTGLALVGPADWSTDLTGAAALTVTVTATEGVGGLTAQATRTLSFAINARPTDVVASGALAIRESSTTDPVANGKVIGSFTRVDADNDAATFSLMNNAGGRFAISTAGVLTVANGTLLNYESATSHSITVRVTDSGGLTRDETFTVAVTNVNEAPGAPVIASRPVTVLAENAAAANVVIANLTLSDPDNTTPSLILTSNPGGLFVVSGTQVKFSPTAALNFEALKAAGYTLQDLDGDGRQEVVLTATVRATDGALQSTDVDVVFRVEDVNEAPTDVTADRTLTVAENAANGVVVAQFTSTDPDAGDTRSFLLVNNAGGRFTLTASGELRVANGTLLDREAAASHTISIKVTDAAGLSYTETFTVAVSNVNETPTTPTVVQLATKAENSALAGTLVTTMAATDPDGTTPTYQIVSDPLSWLVVSGSNLNFRTGLNFNFEALESSSYITVTDIDGDGLKEASYTATIRATDGSLNSTNQTVIVRIEDVNEAFTLGGLSTVTLAESSPGAGQTLVGTVTVTDPDTQAVNRNHVYSLSGTDAALFSINAQGKIYLQGGLNFEADATLNFTVTVKDKGGSGFTATRPVVVTVSDVNERPTVSVVNNYTLTGTDPDGDSITYRVKSVLTTLNWKRSGTQGPTLTGTSTSEVIPANTLSGSQITLRGYTNYNRQGSAEQYNLSETWYTYTYDVVVVSVDEHGVESLPITVHIPQTLYYSSPIVLDLDEDGIEWVALDAGVRFDHDLDGVTDKTGWLNSDDGFLVLDRNGNGTIDDVSELAFAGDVENAVSDLEGLGAYDSNADGVFSDADTAFSSFQIWRDLNQDGVSQQNELMSLADAQIAAINLTLTLSTASSDGNSNVLHGTTEYVRADGTIGLVGDALIIYERGPLSPLLLPPVVLDLDGGGVDLVALSASRTFFDADSDGVLERTGWVAGGEGILAIDRDGNGVIDRGAEISFVGDTPGAVSDLGGLVSYDTNGNGQVDAGDARFADLLIWRDLDGDGVSDAGELSGLVEGGVAAINLAADRTTETATAGENLVYATGAFVRLDGTTGTLSDVMLAFSNISSPTGFDRDGRGIDDDDGLGYSPGAGVFSPPGRRPLPLDTDGPSDSWTWGRWGGDGNRLGQAPQPIPVVGPDPVTGAGEPHVLAPAVNRTADSPSRSSRSSAQAMRQAISAFSKGDRGDMTLTRGHSPNGPPAVATPASRLRGAPIESVFDPEALRQSPERWQGYGAIRDRSALHQGLDLGARTRFQMIEAMASFSVEPFVESGLRRNGGAPAIAPLLTALPDLRSPQ